MKWKNRQDIGYFWLILICFEVAAIVIIGGILLGGLYLSGLYLCDLLVYHCGVQ